MSKPARVRFAPSPTGYLHIGSIRSGLFNYLWAKHTGGSFVLRIEDTDRTRLVPDAIDQINASLEALGIAPDEGPKQGGAYGPYLQSERLDLYHEHAQTLLANGALYRCWCSADRLAELREAAQKAGEAFVYDRHCLKPENQRTSDEPHVLRFRIPDTAGAITWNDAVRGELTFEAETLDDFVALKADGYPTYHFANVVDDHLMEITHVLRADEWIPSTPKHLLLFAAFGWDAPVYGHLPAVLGPSGTKKLSKRDGAQSVSEYIEEGYLPEAIMSFLATLGWNDGTTQEVYSPEELIEKFSLERIQKSPAQFDRERLTWVNGYMIRHLNLDALLARAEDFWPASAKDASSEYKREVLRLNQERLKFLGELAELSEFFFSEATPSSQELTKQLSAEDAARTLTGAREALSNGEWTEANIESALRALVGTLELKPGHVFGLLRLAVTGRSIAPGLFETIHVLGRDAVLARLDAAKSSLNSR